MVSKNHHQQHMPTYFPTWVLFKETIRRLFYLWQTVQESIFLYLKYLKYQNNYIKSDKSKTKNRKYLFYDPLKAPPRKPRLPCGVIIWCPHTFRAQSRISSLQTCTGLYVRVTVALRLAALSAPALKPQGLKWLRPIVFFFTFLL